MLGSLTRELHVDIFNISNTLIKVHRITKFISSKNELANFQIIILPICIIYLDSRNLA